MAKIALVLVFSLTMVLSIRSVVGDDALSPETIDSATDTFKDMAQSVSSTAGSAAESVSDTASSWTDWAKDKLRNYGWLSNSPASSPEMAPASAPIGAYAVRAFGGEPAAAPIIYN